MRELTSHAVTALARVRAGTLAGVTLKVDARSTQALVKRGLLNKTNERGPYRDDSRCYTLTDEGMDVVSGGEVALHLNLEATRAKNKHAELERRTKNEADRKARLDMALRRLWRSNVEED